MRNILIAAVAISAIAAPALAQSVSEPRGYGNLGYTHLDDTSTGAVTGRLGVNLNRFIALETEASVGVKDHDINVAGVDGKIEHDYDAAAYVVGTLPVTPNFELFARGGYGTTKIKTELAGFDGEVDGESWNYGAGANYYLDGQNGLRADWTRRDFRDDAGEADVYSLSYVRRF